MFLPREKRKIVDEIYFLDKIKIQSFKENFCDFSCLALHFSILRSARISAVLIFNLEKCEVAMKLKFMFPLFLLIYEFSAYLSNDMYLSALAEIANDFHSTIDLTQATITLWLAGTAAFQLFIGPLSDRYGRRPILLLGGLLFLLSTLGCAMATGIHYLLLFRFFEGVGVCSLVVAGYAAIHESYKDSEAIHIIAWMSCISILAPMIGPLVGGYVLLLGSWRLIFWMILVMAAASVVGLFVVMPESNKNVDVHALNWHRLRKVYKKILCNRVFVLSGLTFGLIYGGLMIWISASPFILMEHFELTEQEFGLIQVPIFACYGLSTRFVTPLMQKIGRERLILIGLSISVSSIFLMAILTGSMGGYFLSLIVPMCGYAAGFGLVAAPLNRMTLSSTEEKMGAATAIFYLLMAGGGTLMTLCLNLTFNGESRSMIVLLMLSSLIALACNIRRVSRLEFETQESRRM